MKYFITGGAGLVGSAMVDKLLSEPDNEVTVFDNFSSGKKTFLEKYFSNKKFKLVEGDLFNKKHIEHSIGGHTFVFHFAANPDIARSAIETELDINQGIISTYNLIESMRLQNIRAIGFSSSSCIYGDAGDLNTPEDFGPLMPTSLYGASKLGCEGIISAFSHMFEMKSWIFRFPNVVGKNQTHAVGFDFIKKLKQNPKKLIILGNGKQCKSYTHVSDIVNAMLFIVGKTNDIVNIFNIATGDFLTVDEIAKIVVEEMDLKNVEFEYTGGRSGWKGDIPIVKFNIEKIHSTGWKSKYNSKEAFRKSIREMLGKE